MKLSVAPLTALPGVGSAHLKELAIWCAWGREPSHRGLALDGTGERDGSSATHRGEGRCLSAWPSAARTRDPPRQLVASSHLSPSPLLRASWPLPEEAVLLRVPPAAGPEGTQAQLLLWEEGTPDVIPRLSSRQQDSLAALGKSCQIQSFREGRGMGQQY